MTGMRGGSERDTPTAAITDERLLRVIERADRASTSMTPYICAVEWGANP